MRKGMVCGKGCVMWEEKPRQKGSPERSMSKFAVAAVGPKHS